MTRFTPLILERWPLNREYRRFLASYEQLLPFPKASNLSSRELAPKIHDLAGDVIGNTVQVLREATERALTFGRDCIDVEILDFVHSRRDSAWEEVNRRA